MSGVKNSRGAALISVLGLFVILASFLPIISSESQIEYLTARGNLDNLRAKYMAQSGLEMQILKMLIYKQAQKTLKKSQAENLARGYLDLIWSLPAVWPLPETDSMLNSEKKALRDLNAKSLLRGKYMSFAKPTDGKIDINDLTSNITPMREFILQALQRLDVNINEEKEFTDTPNWLEDLIDWLDADKQKISGGFEDGPDYAHRDMPNRSMAFIEELQTVPSLSSEKYQAIKEYLTVYGAKGININHADFQVLRALGFSLDVAEQIRSRTSPESEYYQIFQDQKDFCNFLENVDLCKSPFFQFNTPLHFKISSQGSSKNQISKAETMIYDVNQSIEKYKQAMKQEEELVENMQNSKKTKPLSKKKNQEGLNLGEVFAPLTIMYWKEGL